MQVKVILSCWLWFLYFIETGLAYFQEYYLSRGEEIKIFLFKNYRVQRSFSRYSNMIQGGFYQYLGGNQSFLFSLL